MIDSVGCTTGSHQHWVFPHEINLSEMSWSREDHQYSMSGVWREGGYHSLTDHPGTDPSRCG